MFFFFFKQKTAYEMRISDWSSDVCSSDLARGVDGFAVVFLDVGLGTQRGPHRARLQAADAHGGVGQFGVQHADQRGRGVLGEAVAAPVGRSEEHTSELQSLMRISYAVFCLKKKNLINLLLLYLSYPIISYIINITN